MFTERSATNAYRYFRILPLLLTGVFMCKVKAGLPVQPEQIVVTCFSGTINYYSSPPTATPNLNSNGYVVALFDTTTGNIGPLIPPTSAPPELWDAFDIPPFSGFHNETGQPWNAQRLGEVFGICVDDATPPNIYVTATEAYNIIGSATPLPKGAGGPGGIYRLDGTTGASTSGSLPNNSINGPGLGNVCFRRAGSGSGYLYVSDLEDGKIYRMDPTTLTQVGSPYDHGVSGRPNESLSQIVDDGTPGLTQFGRRVWGLQTYQSRLYYAVWWEDSRNISLTESNEIWSVDLDNAGDFIPSTARRRISLPNFTINQWSHPVASIDFSPSGTMFLAERYWQYYAMVPNAQFGAHHTRILRYTQSGPNWVTTPNTTHHIGGDASFYFPNTQLGANSAGGVAVNCDESIWATGDMWAGSYSSPPNLPFCCGDLGYVYGALRIPTGGNSMYAGPGYGSFAIDYDGNTSSVAKFGVGAIATVRDCCVAPPSGMVAWWPLDEPAGATTYADLSGSGNTALVESGGPLGSFQSPSPTAGKVAGASLFLDSLTRGRAPNSPSLNFGTNSFSLDCWVKPPNPTPNTWQTIVDKLDNSTSRGYTVGISNGNVVLRVRDGTVYTHTGPAITYFTWNFVAVAVNRTTGALRFFVNGTASAPQPLLLTGNVSNSVDLLIGAPYGANVVSETSLDEIELFNRALTTNEVFSIWDAGSIGKCKAGQPPCSNSVVSIVCPTNMTVACAPVVHYPPPHASTTCGTITNITCTPPSGSVFPTGSNLVTCVAYDSLGNSNSCSFVITVLPDVTPPQINCVCLQNSAEEALNVTGCQGIVPSLCNFLNANCVVDDCCLGACTQNPPAGTQVGSGVTPITFTVFDCAGNSNSCVLQMTVTPPPGGCGTNADCLLTCPTNLIVTACGSNAVVNFPAPVLSSNCPPGATIICSPPSGSAFPLGTNTVTCAVVDGGSGSIVASCQFTVTVLAQNPTWDVICPDPASSINVTGCPPKMPDLSGFITIVTNCPTTCPITVNQSIPPGTPLTAGTHVAILNVCQCETNCHICDVTINAYASGGNPTITCPPNQTVITCDSSAIVKYKVQASGYSGVVVCTPPSGSVFPLGTTLVTCTATNACGGSATCSFTVTVKRPITRWPCGWQVGIGIPFETVGGASTALKAVAPGGPGYPAICVFPNFGNPASGVQLHLGQAQAFTFTTVIDFTAPVGAGMDLVLPPGSMNTNNTPLLSIRNRGQTGYGVRFNKSFADDPKGLFRTIAVNTNGHLLDSFTFDAQEARTNDTLLINHQPGVTNCHVTVELNLVDGTMSVEFDGPVTPSAAGRKGWDGCIYGPDRPVKKPKQTARVIVIPPVSPGQPSISDLFLYGSGMEEIGVEEPAVTAKDRKWGDGHVTLIKAYDDGQSVEFAAMGHEEVPVHVELGHAESFDLNLTRLETNAIPDESLLTRTVGPISGLSGIEPPFLDALLLKASAKGIECSADFSNLGSPTLHVQIFNKGVLQAERHGVKGGLDQLALILSKWPTRLGKLGGTTPCRRGNVPLSSITLPDTGAGLPPEVVDGDEFRILAELPPGTPKPDYYREFEFFASEGADWGVSELTTIPVCVPQPVALLETNGTVTVKWSWEPFRLLGAEQATGPWFDLGAGSPVTVPASSKARFFRLLCD